jgi:hypothetical protein
VDNFLGQALFVLAVGPNLVLLVIGLGLGVLWLVQTMLKKKPVRDDDQPVVRRPRTIGAGTLFAMAGVTAVLLLVSFVRGDHGFGQTMFILAVGPNLVLLAYGVVRGAIWLLGAALSTMATPAHRHAHPDDAFHHPDPIATPAIEQLFMMGAIGFLVVGLPVALGAIFHFVLPLIGDGWGQ